MPTIIVNKQLFISVREVMSFMQDFQNDMEHKRKGALIDIKNQDLLPPIRKMANKLTHLDFDLFNETLEKNIGNYRQMIYKRTDELTKEKKK